MSQACALWQLAPDRDAYGDRAGWWILTTPDGETELAGPWPTAEGAIDYAKQAGWVLETAPTG